MKILLVEDDPLTAETIRALVETGEDHEIVAVAQDLDSVAALSDVDGIDLALVDLNLAHQSTGYIVAKHLQTRDVPSLFITGGRPPFPMPELALGCLSKPITLDTLSTALTAVATGDRCTNGSQLWAREDAN